MGDRGRRVAVAAAIFWADLATNIDTALGTIEAVVNPGP